MKLLLSCILTLALFGSFISPADDAKAKEQFKAEFLTRINKLRHDGCRCGAVYMPPVPPLVWNDQLAAAANQHAGDMFLHNYLAHKSRRGTSPMDRAVEAGYTTKGFKRYIMGENIAKGNFTIAQVMDEWIKSPEHCKNLMNREFKEVGIAQSYSYWVQDFGGRIPFSASEKKLIKSGRLRIINEPINNN